jgi:hypothetical protein
MSQEFPRTLPGTDTKHHEIMYGSHCYSRCSIGNNAEYAWLTSIKCTNFNLKDAACLHVVHICNIRHLTLEHCQHNIHSSMFRRRNFCHSWRRNLAHRQTTPHIDVFMRMMATAGWMQNGSEHLEHCPACDGKADCAREITWNTLRKQQREGEMD